MAHRQANNDEILTRNKRINDCVEWAQNKTESYTRPDSYSFAVQITVVIWYSQIIRMKSTSDASIGPCAAMYRRLPFKSFRERGGKVRLSTVLKYRVFSSLIYLHKGSIDIIGFVVWSKYDAIVIVYLKTKENYLYLFFWNSLWRYMAEHLYNDSSVGYLLLHLQYMGKSLSFPS